MIQKCEICGKEIVVLYPEMWRYRSGEKWLCSWRCLRENERKEAETMAYPKKEGTQTKRPARKPKTDTEETAKKAEEKQDVALVYDPSILEEYKRENPEEYKRAKMKEPLEVCAVRSRALRDGWYRKNTSGGAMILGGLSMADDHLGLSAKKWKELCGEILEAMEQLGIKEPEKAEIEGGGSTWWYACPECHGAIDRSDKFCKHCGMMINNER